ncbi:hypothetical protein D3C73_1586090 [compost metagenome]
MAQSLLHGSTASLDATLLDECRRCLKMVGLMPESDLRYPRYQKLRDKAFGE